MYSSTNCRYIYRAKINNEISKKINRSSILRATVTGPCLNVCRKHAHQVCSLLYYQLSNCTAYDWLSFLAYLTVVPYLNF